MKAKVTRKQVEEGFAIIQKVPFCYLYNLLEGGAYPSMYYNMTQSGVQFNVYCHMDYPTVCVTTGAGPVGEYILSSDEIKEWNKKAEGKNCEEKKKLYSELFEVIYRRGLEKIRRDW